MDSAQFQAPTAGTWLDPNLCSTYGDTTEACVSQDVADHCDVLAKAGCIELIVAESCPVQLSCATTVCPSSEPEPGSACTANGLTCTLVTYTCPGTTLPITTSWAECMDNQWAIGMASIRCPEPGVSGGAIAAGVIGGCAVLLVAALAFVLRGKRTKQEKPEATMPRKPDVIQTKHQLTKAESNSKA